VSVVTRIRTQKGLVVPYTPEEVWAVLSDVTEYPQWWPARFPVRVLEGGSGLIGSAIEVRPRLSRTFCCRFEEADEPRSMRVRFFGGALEGPCYLVLDPLEGATRVRLEIDVFARGFGTAVLSFIVPFERLHEMQVRRLLSALRNRLAVMSEKESTPPSSVAISVVPPVLDTQSNLDQARLYLHNLSSPSLPEEIARHFHEDAFEEEFANPVFPKGERRDLRGIIAARARSQAAWTLQKFEMRSATAGGSQVALEVFWTGTAASATDVVSEGQTVEARLAFFLKFKGRRIVRQRTYVSFSPDLPDFEDLDDASDASAGTGLRVDGSAKIESRPHSHFDIARGYLTALSEGHGPEAIARFFSEDAIQELLPSPLNPRGARRSRTSIARAREKSLALFPAETNDLRGASGGGSKVALEVLWSGVAAADRPAFGRGQEVESHSAVFLEFRDGLIVRQRNYDCVTTRGAAS
jgi:ketosteroid isomerase-like protein